MSAVASFLVSTYTHISSIVLSEIFRVELHGIAESTL